MLNSSMVLCEKYLFVFFLFFFFFHLLGCGIIGSLFAIFRGLWVTSLLARALSEPLGKLPGWPLHPFVALFLPDLVQLGQPFVSESTLVHFLPVVIGSGVSSALILGVHPYLGWVVSNKGIGVESLLQGLLSQLGLLPFLEFLEGEDLFCLLLLHVVSVGFELNGHVVELFSLLSQLIRSQFFEGEGLNSDAKSDLLLFFELLLGFAHFLAGITGVSVTLASLSEASLLFFLCLKHGLSLGLGFFQQLLLGFGFLLPLLSLLLFRLLLLLLLLLVEFFLLLGPDLFPLGLFVLELLQLLLFGFPRFLPFCDVFLEGFVKGGLSLSWILNLSHDVLLCDFLS